jgi:hypothetical protein
MVRSDLPRLPNPAALIFLIAATEPEFDLWIFLINLPARQQLPARGVHASALIAGWFPSIHTATAPRQRIARMACNLCLQEQLCSDSSVFSSQARHRAVPSLWSNRLP